MNDVTVTIEFTLQSFNGKENMTALRSWVDGNTVPLSHPGKEVLWKFAERFRVVIDGEGREFLHVESERE